ncbi:30S ribosomal protein S2, partial [Dissostichus eleginoides]
WLMLLSRSGMTMKGPPTPTALPMAFIFPVSVRGPQKLSSGSHKDGWGSAACSTFFTGDRWWGFLGQVSVPLQARRSGTGRIAPCRRVCSKVMIVTSPPPSSCACSQAPSDTSAIR